MASYCCKIKLFVPAEQSVVVYICVNAVSYILQVAHYCPFQLRCSTVLPPDFSTLCFNASCQGLKLRNRLKFPQKHCLTREMVAERLFCTRPVEATIWHRSRCSYRPESTSTSRTMQVGPGGNSHYILPVSHTSDCKQSQ